MQKVMPYETLLVEQRDFYLEVTLNRPQSRNAMSLAMVQELSHLFSELEQDSEFAHSIRAVILCGSGGHFCAGGDIKDMAGNAQDFTNLNRAFGAMIQQADRLPQTLIVVLEGAVLGGGFGLACVSDVAITRKNAQFGLPETGLGVIPAQIAPFVVTRIGLTQARRLALLGERFNGEEAHRLGIVHYQCDTPEALSQQLQQVLKQVQRCAPQANRVTKQLLHQVGQQDMNDLLDGAAHSFATAVTGPEGQEGTRAFVDKRLPNWVTGNNKS